MNNTLKLGLGTLLVGAVCGTLMATQDTDITRRELRDPRQLEAWLEANASDAETRLAALGSTASATMVLTNSANAGSCYILMHTDKNDDAGDQARLQVADGGTLTYATDKDSQGTLATKFSIDCDGDITLDGGATMDNTTSATVLTIKEDTVAVDGAFDADSVTVDAGAGIDANSAGALGVGLTTATSVNIGKTLLPTTIKGTFNVDEAATFDSTATFTGKTSHDLGIDADYIDVDAGGDGIDTATAGALTVGGTTATSINVGKTTKMTTIIGTLNCDEAVTMDSTLLVSGETTLTLDLDIDGGDITCPADLTITPAGGDVICAATVDATAYTADASAGLDTKTAGALELGTTTATSVNVGVSGGATTIKGTFNVDEAATFDTTVGVTGSLTVNGASILGDGSTTATNIDIYYAKTSFEGPVGVAVAAAGNFTTIGASDVITSSDTTVSSSKDTGAFVTEGGIGVEEDVYAGGQIVAVGNIDAASFSVSAAPGLTTNIVITTASGSITNTFSFTAGLLTGYTVAP